MTNQTEIAEIISVISAAYPNFNPSPQTLEVYYQALRDINFDQLKQATMHSITENGRRFAPSVGELRGAVADLRMYIDNIPTSYQAWQEVQEQMQLTGSYRKPTWTHPSIEKTVNVFGWRKLCLSEDEVSDRMRFIQCYERFFDRDSRERMMLPEVRGYLEVNGTRILSPIDQMKQLTNRLSK